MPMNPQPEDQPFDGRWWWPGDADLVVGGRLFRDGGFWHLALLGWLGPYSSADSELDVPDVLHGQVGTTPFTLLDLVYQGSTRGGQERPYRTSIIANRVLAGAHVFADTRFNSASVRLANLNEWANRRPWEFSFDRVDDRREESVAFSEPPPLTAQLPGAGVQLWRNWGRSGGGLSDVKLSSSEIIHFDLETPRSLEEVEHEWVRPFRHLLELAASARCPVIELTLTLERDSNYPDLVTVFSAVGDQHSEVKQSFFFLFTLEEVDFSEVVEAWWELHSDLGIVPDLVAELRKSDRHGGALFLTAASAVEGYHRHRNRRRKATPDHKRRLAGILDSAPVADREWLREKLRFSHEPTFADRISEVVLYAGPMFADLVGDLESWIQWVKNSRNSVAHRDPKMNRPEDDWKTTIWVTESIRWLMTLVLLNELGVPADIVEGGVRRERGLAGTRRALQSVQPRWYGISPTGQSS
ncbi:MAG: HEPN domain-containing protein [Acidimicrobiales bacterium]